MALTNTTGAVFLDRKMEIRFIGLDTFNMDLSGELLDGSVRSPCV